MRRRITPIVRTASTHLFLRGRYISDLPNHKSSPIPDTEPPFNSNLPPELLHTQTIPFAPHGEISPPYSPITNFPRYTITEPQKHYPKIESSVLENGCQIISTNANLGQGSISLYVKGAGSRNENSHQIGFSHWMKHLVFRRTVNLSPVALVRELEHQTTSFTSTATREYHSLNALGIDDLLLSASNAFLLDVTRPKLREYIFREVSEIVSAETHEAQHDLSLNVSETVHRVAFRNGGIGNSLYCPTDRFDHLIYDGHEEFENFVLTWYQPENFVVVANGLPHDQVVFSIRSAFDLLPIGDEPPPNVRAPIPRPANGASKYTGGECQVPSHGDTHVAVALNGVSRTDKDRFAAQVLAKLAGGSCRYSKDGPGRGLTSRAFRQLVRGNPNVSAATAFNFSYSDAGLFGVYVHAKEGNAPIVNSVADFLAGLPNFNEQEFTTARNQAKACFLKNTETFTGFSDFLSRQNMDGANGNYVQPDEYASNYDSVTPQQVQDLAKRLLSSEPTVVAAGDVVNLPSYLEVRSRLGK